MSGSDGAPLEQLARLRLEAVAARNRADSGEDSGLLGLGQACALAPEQAAAVGEARRAAAEWDWREEARLRETAARSRGAWAEARRLLASADLAERRAGAAKLEGAVAPLATRTTASPPRALPRPQPAGARSAGGLVLPSAVEIAALTAAAPLPPVLEDSGLPARIAPPAAVPWSSAVSDLLRGEARALLGQAPTLFADLWRSADGRHVGDFAEPGLLQAPAGLALLSSPLAPAGRPGALAAYERTALGVIERCLGLESAGVHAAGSALVWSTPGRVFARRALGGSALPARRALASALLLSIAVGWSAEAASSADELGDRLRHGVGHTPPASWVASLWAATVLSRAPFEQAWYPLVSPATRWLRALGQAVVLRDLFDEDWFLNPRATAEVIRALPLPPSPSMAAVAAWLDQALR